MGRPIQTMRMGQATTPITDMRDDLVIARSVNAAGEHLELRIGVDGDPENPREWDNLGTMAFMHRRYSLGDKHPFRSPEEIAEHVKATRAVALPVWMFDHSGLTLATDPTMFRAFDGAGWDWGQLGVIYAEADRVRSVFRVKIITAEVRARAVAQLEGEVSDYNLYLQGLCYGYEAIRDGDTVDSCWGFFTDDPFGADSAIRSYLDGEFVALFDAMAGGRR